jgi:hypothetical protein
MKTMTALALAVLLASAAHVVPDPCMTLAELLRDVATRTVEPDPTRAQILLEACRDDLTPEEAERKLQRLREEHASAR